MSRLGGTGFQALDRSRQALSASTQQGFQQLLAVNEQRHQQFLAALQEWQRRREQKKAEKEAKKKDKGGIGALIGGGAGAGTGALTGFLVGGPAGALVGAGTGAIGGATSGYGAGKQGKLGLAGLQGVGSGAMSGLGAGLGASAAKTSSMMLKTASSVAGGTPGTVLGSTTPVANAGSSPITPTSVSGMEAPMNIGVNQPMRLLPDSVSAKTSVPSTWGIPDTEWRGALLGGMFPQAAAQNAMWAEGPHGQLEMERLGLERERLGLRREEIEMKRPYYAGGYRGGRYAGDIPPGLEDKVLGDILSPANIPPQFKGKEELPIPVLSFLRRRGIIPGAAAEQRDDPVRQLERITGLRKLYTDEDFTTDLPEGESERIVGILDEEANKLVKKIEAGNLSDRPLYPQPKGLSSSGRKPAQSMEELEQQLEAATTETERHVLIETATFLTPEQKKEWRRRRGGS